MGRGPGCSISHTERSMKKMFGFLKGFHVKRGNPMQVFKWTLGTGVLLMLIFLSSPPLSAQYMRNAGAVVRYNGPSVHINSYSGGSIQSGYSRYSGYSGYSRNAGVSEYYGLGRGGRSGVYVVSPRIIVVPDRYYLPPPPHRPPHYPPFAPGFGPGWNGKPQKPRPPFSSRSFRR